MFDALLWGIVSGGIAALTGRPWGEVAGAAAGGVAARYVVGAAAVDAGLRAACLADVLEYLVVRGEAADVSIAPAGDKVTFAAPNEAAGQRATAALQRCAPKRAYYNPYSNKVTAEF